MDEQAAKSRRLFVGIALDREVRNACALAAEQLRRRGFDAKFEDPSKFHITLAFLGNVADARFKEISGAFESCARGGPFALRFDRLGAFPHERKPRIVYVGAREQGARFRTLATSVREAYERIGFTFDDDAVAHITIARVKHPRHALSPIEFAPIELQVKEISLFESIFDPKLNTSRYEIIGTA